MGLSITVSFLDLEIVSVPSYSQGHQPSLRTRIARKADSATYESVLATDNFPAMDTLFFQDRFEVHGYRLR